jgi:thiamine kinase-like enzyme
MRCIVPAGVLTDSEIAALSDLLASRRLRAAKLESLSPPGTGRKAGRCTLRVETQEGRVFKLRRMESAGAAAELAGLRARVDLRFLPPMQRSGALLLEPWIDGETLSPSRAEALARELGALMGRLHAARPANAPARVATAGRREQALSDLARLVSAGALPASSAETLRGRIAGGDPGSAPAVLVHRDFCPENLVLDPAGELFLIDNEWLALDAAGVDLGRSFSRWSLPEAPWQTFLSGYAGQAPAAPEALPFWLVAMAARSACLRLAAPAEAIALPLARLRALASA